MADASVEDVRDSSRDSTAAIIEAVKAALDEGDYDRAAALLGVLRSAGASDGNVVRLAGRRTGR